MIASDVKALRIEVDQQHRSCEVLGHGFDLAENSSRHKRGVKIGD